MRKRTTYVLTLAVAGAMTLLASGRSDTPVSGAGPDQVTIPPEVAARIEAARAAAGGESPKQEFPKWDDVAKDYEKVVSTADGAKSLYTIWTRPKDAQMLAELPREFESQKLFIAYNIAGGIPTAGVQMGDRYAYWKRFDKRLALIEPNYEVRTSGDTESRKGRDRVYTDSVILDVPIVTMGPGGGPVIDMDALLLGNASQFFGWRAQGANTGLAKIARAKAFPRNVELAFELPLQGGRFGTMHYSFSVLPEDTGYKPRVADERIGYFATTHMDIGHPDRDMPWIRYINRWKLEKADPKLKMSPPKEPIIFYLEHTTPVRYRRWVREGVLEWNKAFEKVGIVGAIEVYQQDVRTGAHMDKDPEDARFNFLLWTNSNMGFAIGPSRVDPRTGQIIDADIVMDEGFISSWVDQWRRTIPETAMRNFGPETLNWLATRPQWDPRVRLTAPPERPQKIRQLAEHWHRHQAFGGHPAAGADATLLGDDPYDGLAGRVSQVNGHCTFAASAGLELALFRMEPALLTELAMGIADDDEDKDDVDDDDEADDDDEDDVDDDDEDDVDDDDEADDGDEADDASAKGAGDEQMLDGVPESFIGPLLKGVIMHEVGHTLGLRHNFKASTVYTLEEINSEARKGMPITGSVMDYTPVNINVKDGTTQGEYAMRTIGPYDYWAIEFGYTMEPDLKPILARVAEPELIYGTDEDSWGSDPRARVFDLGRDPLNYSESLMRLVTHLRGQLLDRMVKEGDSWAKARSAYELLLSRQFRAISNAANFVGGAESNRDKKGDPGDRETVKPASVEQQRRALRFVIESALRDEAYGLTPELLSRMSVDKWWDEGGFSTIFEDPAWPVHERILGLQAATLTMLMNPTTLNRVYDNEYRTPAGEDAITLPEVLWGVTDEVWSELDGNPRRQMTAREPMISSLRRNLQREHLERLIDLTLPNDSFGVAGKPVANLATHKLRDLADKIGKAVDRRTTKLDPYTLAHLSEARIRIDRALDAQYIYNTDDISSGGDVPFFFFGNETGR